MREVPKNLARVPSRIPKPSEKKDQAQQHRSAKGTENYAFQTDPSDLLDLLECILAERDVGKLQRAVFEHYSRTLRDRTGDSFGRQAMLRAPNLHKTAMLRSSLALHCAQP